MTANAPRPISLLPRCSLTSNNAASSTPRSLCGVGDLDDCPRTKAVTGATINPFGFSMWLAGGGVRGGLAYGATDEFGYAAVENKVHVHDLHATILHLLGINHEQLTYRHLGRNFRSLTWGVGW